MDLDSAYKWSKDGLVDFNLLKCVVMHFGPNNKLHNYRMGSVELSNSVCERDLGVVFSSDLKWKQQSIACVSKANAMLGMIKNNFVKLDTRMVKILYTVYVRPLIEFAVPVWSPYLKGDINLIEKVQHRATRLIPGLKKLPYYERLEKLGLSTLENEE